MLTPRPAACRRGQWSLVGTLIAVAILIALAALYIPRIAARHSEAGQAATPIERGYGAACTIYQSEINTAAQSYKMDHDGRPPHSLDDLVNPKYGVTADMVHAPGCSFQMDASGAVTDVGHGQAQPGASFSQPATTAPAGGQRGPGGVVIPNIPGSGGASADGDTP